MKRLVVATHNLKKGGEMVQILQEGLPGLEILTLADFPGAPEPEEVGTNYHENALIKSRSATAFTGEWCIADDAGLEIDALDGAPGLYSKRFGGEGLPFPEKMALILEKLKDVPEEKRTAKFRCVVALSGPDGSEETFEAIREGRIALEPLGSGGFGYDPIFYVPELGKMMAELTPNEKHAISHRGMVLRKVIETLRSRGIG